MLACNNLEKSLLTASGCQTDEEVNTYIKKLDSIQDHFEIYLRKFKNNKTYQKFKQSSFSSSADAWALFEYFWETKPKRYNSNFLLKDVIDAQLDNDQNQAVGDCFGLTSLYTVIGLREELNLSLITGLTFSEDKGHILNRLREGSEIMNIENTYRYGFDTGEYNKKYIELPPQYLIEGTYTKDGKRMVDSGEFEEAIKQLDKAIGCSPKTPQPYLERSRAKLALLDLDGSIADLKRFNSLV